MISQSPRAQSFFLSAGTRSLYCLHYAPIAPLARGAILYIHPFAEEMNKSRHMVALQARLLAGAGWHVLQLDLTGCGDSSGDIADTGWDIWLDDILMARRWLHEHCPGPLWVWGLRLGALLGAASLAQMPAADAGLLLWQPVISGSQHLQQFLRIKVAGERVAAGQEGIGTQELFEQLRAGQSIEIAGYELAPQLALPMAEASLALPPGVPRVRWLEVQPRAEGSLAPVSRRLVESWQKTTQLDLVTKIVQGPSFWQTQEIEQAPQLLAATLEGLEE